MIQDRITIYGGVPWSIERRRLTDLETDPQFVLSALRREATGENLMRLDARLSEVKFKGQPNELHQTTTMTVYLDPGKGWAVRSYESKIRRSFANATNNLLAKGTVEYRNDVPAFPPVPLRQKLVMCDPDGTERVTMITEFPEWKYRDEIEEEELGLTAFGLPEPVGVPQRGRRVPNYVWFIAAAAGCAILGAGFRYLARRGRPRPAAG
jgi:hypothetical protein